VLICSVLLALLIGWAGGGRLSRWEDAGLRLLPLPVLALLLQRGLGLLPSGAYDAWAPVILLLSYGSLLAFCLGNRRMPKTALLTGLGSLCNLAVIAANGFRMPVSQQAAALLSPAGLADLQALRIPMYALASGDTRLLFLGDIFYCPIPFLSGFASIGDLLLALGVFFALMAAMAPPRLPRWLCTG